MKTKFTFDNNTFRHAMNGHESVLHCHHYMALTSKLAMDFDAMGGTRILKESAEDSVRPLLDDYFTQNSISDAKQRLQIGAEYFGIMGMGVMKISGDDKTGEVKLTHSHVDEGWIKKWGKSSKPVNHFTCGYANAVFAAAYSLPPRSFQSMEVSSIALGDEEAIISVKRS
ncbi:MAG: hypothetical protein JXR76_08720 [Deltaproteobacteria bacterium]|nr:hypothetical protein [Deltaproteobacteria bacterium]